ncbi:MAG: hypothetical protein IJW01_00805 [Paludibacteraceae bacterium]|nr:hypothetical protein [Paludibacteraceae bacterium]
MASDLDKTLESLNKKQYKEQSALANKNYRLANKGKVRSLYYDHNGDWQVSCLKLGMGFGSDFPFCFEIVTFRVKMFESALLAFRYDCMKEYFVWEPQFRLNIPVAERWAIFTGVGPTLCIDVGGGDVSGWFTASVGARFNWGFDNFFSDFYFAYNGDLVVGVNIAIGGGW